MKLRLRGGLRAFFRLVAGGVALACALAPAPARAQVAAESYCVVGLGAAIDATADGWLAVVTPAGGVTPVALPTTLVNPWDCAIDPTTGDVIVADLGGLGGATDAVIYRVRPGGAPLQTVVHAGAPLVNPFGVSVASDGTIHVPDAGGTLGATSNDGAVYAIPPAGVLTRLDTGGVTLDDPFDVDVDPRPFAAPSAGINLIVLDRFGRIDRVPTAGGSVVTVDGGPGGNRWHAIEVGPYGGYFLANHDLRRIDRYSRVDDTRRVVATGSAGGTLDRPQGISVDYRTADLVVADLASGVVNVPPNAYIAGAPGATTVAAAGALPGPQAAGIGFSPPPASGDPSANFGAPTRRAPIPGGGAHLIGPAGGTGFGDVEREMNFFIEVTSTADPLGLHLYDINLRNALDRLRSSSLNTRTIVTVYDPAGAVIATNTINANGRADLDQRFATVTCASMPATPCNGVGPNPNATLAVRGAGIPLAAGAEGVYRLRIALPNDGGNEDDDYQSFGVWIENFHAYTYAPTYGVSNTGDEHPRLQGLDPLRLYPYFDRGCELTTSNWDWDLVDNAGTSAAVISREGESFGVTLSVNTSEHAETLLDPAPGAGATSSSETDYGVWTYAPSVALDLSGGTNNYVSERMPDFNGWVNGGGNGLPVPVPVGNAAANPTASLLTSPGPAYNQEAFGAASNTFLRYYLARYDETPDPLAPAGLVGAAPPSAPYMMHSATPISGDPPVDGGPPAYYLVQVTVVNPDPVNALSGVSLTAPVPAPALFVTSGPDIAGGPTTTGGVGGVAGASCAAPCSGDVTADWTSIAPGESATLSYAVSVTASAPGQTLFLTEGPRFRGGGASPAGNPAPPEPDPAPPADMGTRASFTPAWQSATFARSESLGPLCDLSVLEGTVTPIAVDLASFEATPGDGEVLVTWETASEFENLGFWVYRRLEGESDFTRLPDFLILGRGTSDFTARYALYDRGLPNGVPVEYLLEDVEIDGDSVLHGPRFATPEAGAGIPPLDPADYDVVAEGGAGAGGGDGGGGPAAGGGDSSSGPGFGSFAVLESDGSSILVEISIPEAQLDEVELDGVSWTSVSIPGFVDSATPGWPALPGRSYWVNAPDVVAVDVEIVERDARVVSLAAPVLPVPTAFADGEDVLTTTEPDPGAYTSASPYPAIEAALAGSVPSDGGRLLSLRVQPARFTASEGTLELASRYLVRIHLGGPAPLDAGADEGEIAANIRAVAASPGVKLGTRGAGLVRVDAAALTAAELAAEVDPRNLHLFRAGREVAVQIEGGWDGHLDDGDALLFWAEGVDTRYTDEEVFFLVPGDTPGLRVAEEDAAPGPLAGAATANAHARFEEQSVYLPTLLNGEGDNYVGRFVFSAPVASAVSTPGATGAEAVLQVRLRGGTTFAGVEPDHHFGVEIDGVEVADASFDGTELFETLVLLPPWMVGSDETTVTVVPRFDGAVPHLDLVYVDGFDLYYRRALELVPDDAGSLVFEAEGDGAYEIAGLPPSGGVAVWDVTDPDAPRALTDLERSGDRVAFEGRDGARYAVVGDAGLKGPSSARANAPSAWTAGGAADWLAIAHGSLVDGALALAELREAQGLRTAVVDVEDVYDEMSGGLSTPLAIRDFVRAVSASWSPAPRYLVLIGEANYDYRDHLGGSAPDQVPTLLVDTTFVEAASDSALGERDGDAAADLAVGRIPVRTPEALAAVVDKLAAYEAAGVDGSPWQTRILLVADDGLHDGDPIEAAAFEGLANGFAAELPPALEPERVYLAQIDEGDDQGEVAHDRIMDAFGGGIAVALYAGHGGPRVWADELVLGAGDVPGLGAAERLPVVIALNCLNGFFDAPNEESLAELALEADAQGAVAFVSSTTVNALAGQDAFARALGERLGTGNVRVVGDALLQAQQAIAGAGDTEDVLRTFVLLGDPATRLSIPAAAFPPPEPGAPPGPGCAGDDETLVDSLYWLVPFVAARRRRRRRDA